MYTADHQLPDRPALGEPGLGTGNFDGGAVPSCWAREPLRDWLWWSLQEWCLPGVGGLFQHPGFHRKQGAPAEPW